MYALICRGKKRRGLAYKDSSAGYDGYLIEDKRWRLAPTAMGGTVPEDEVQEVTIEMKEENAKPSGTTIVHSFIELHS